MENLPVVHTKKFCCKFRSGRKVEEARYSKPALYIYIYILKILIGICAGASPFIPYWNPYLVPSQPSKPLLVFFQIFIQPLTGT